MIDRKKAEIQVYVFCTTTEDLAFITNKKKTGFSFTFCSLQVYKKRCGCFKIVWPNYQRSYTELRN